MQEEFLGQKYVQEEFLGDEALGEKYMGAKHVQEEFLENLAFTWVLLVLPDIALISARCKGCSRHWVYKYK